MAVIDFPTEYGLTYPIQKTPGPWLVVGVTVHANRADGVHSLDIHFDGDDPNFVFERPEDWPELSVKTVERYNAPYRKENRLARRRATELSAEYFRLWHNHDHAEIEMALIRARRRNPGKSVWVTGYTRNKGQVVMGFVPA